MSFDSREQSLAAGQPLRLYRFSRGVLRWLYNSSDRDITLGSEVYRSVRGGLSDNGIQQSGDSAQDEFVITAPGDLEVAQLYRIFPPSEEVALAVFDMHYGDSEALASWAGSIATVNWPQPDRCKIACLSLEASMEQPGLVDTYSRSCTAVLGDTQCRVDLNGYRVTATPQSRDGLSVFSGTFAGYPDGWFTAGYVEWPVGSGEYDRRHIEAHSGAELRLLGGTGGIPLATELRVYPGCDFLIGTCDAKFGNSLNFRGQPHLQGESPFDGNQVW